VTSVTYSFEVTAATKAEAKQKIAKEFDNVVAYQPIHAADRAPAQAAGEAFIDALIDPPDGQEIYVNIYGSVGCRGEKDITGANVSVRALLTPKR
jgi:hypothetical protein